MDGRILTVPRLMTAREAAATLCVSERTLWQLAKDGAIPCVRIGRAKRYDIADIRAFIESRKVTLRESSTAELSPSTIPPAPRDGVDERGPATLANGYAGVDH
jgi:excisionase family DNA binding protein